MENTDLEELRKETAEKENIVLAMHGGLAAFSITCLLTIVATDSTSSLAIVASCMFVLSAICFLVIVLSKYHVLHKSRDMHIGHVIVSEDHAKTPQVIGVSCLLLGCLAMLLSYSVFTFFVSFIGIIAAAKHHNKFKTEMDKMLGAREAIKGDR